jgi:uncharacterized membrane protein
MKIGPRFNISPLGGPSLAFLPEGRRDVQEANAALIAAAPEMYEVLQAVAAHFANTDAPLGMKARAVLAKARGEVIS